MRIRPKLDPIPQMIFRVNIAKACHLCYNEKNYTYRRYA